MSTQNTADQLVKQNQQRLTVAENKPAPRLEGNQKVNGKHIEEIIKLHHKSSPKLESRRKSEKEDTSLRRL